MGNKCTTLLSGDQWPRRLVKNQRFGYLLIFRATETIFTGTRTQDIFFVVVAFVPVISSPKQTIWSWRRSYIVLSFRTTKTTLPGLESRTLLRLFTFLKYLSPFKV
jgi:hypothetical protein